MYSIVERPGSRFLHWVKYQDEDGSYLIPYHKSRMTYFKHILDPEYFYFRFTDKFSEWVGLTREERKQFFKEQIENMANYQTTAPTVNTLNCPLTWLNEINSLAICPPIPVSYQDQTAQCKKMKEDTMHTDANLETRQREQLSYRVDHVASEKDNEARHFFGLVDDGYPSTAGDLIARITGGKYMVASDKMDTETYGSPTRYIRWRDPAVKEDQNGYKAALDKIEAAQEIVNDMASFAPLADAFKAFNDFKAATFH